MWADLKLYFSELSPILWKCACRMLQLYLLNQFSRRDFNLKRLSFAESVLYISWILTVFSGLYFAETALTSASSAFTQHTTRYTNFDETFFRGSWQLVEIYCSVLSTHIGSFQTLVCSRKMLLIATLMGLYFAEKALTSGVSSQQLLNQLWWETLDFNFDEAFFCSESFQLLVYSHGILSLSLSWFQLWWDSILLRKLNFWQCSLRIA